MKKIFLTKGSGEGLTEIGAYCKALKNAGIINLNIIRLTSVLPHDSIVIDEKPQFKHEDYGKKIYAVLSEIRTSTQGKEACAGLGWIKEKNGTGHGIIVEIQGENEKTVKKQINDSLLEIAKGNLYEGITIVTEVIKCEKNPVCALVAMVFELEGWN